MPGTNQRVLHVVENMHRGAVENWLLRMLRHGRDKGYKLDWTFYCVVARRGALDDEIRALGGRILYSAVPLGRKWEFIRQLRFQLKIGHYGILHCHHDIVSGVYLAAAAGLPLAGRLVHVHNADENVPTPNTWKKALARPILRQTCLLLSDRIVVVSHHVLDTFLRGREPRFERDLVHYYGVDPRPFSSLVDDRNDFREALGMPHSSLILLFAGRLVPEKNPLFAVEVLAEMIRRDSRVAGVFVGCGSLDAEVKQKAKNLGIETNVHLLGWRDDVAHIMAQCDWFILPRPEKPKEGFGLAIVEAQLAGLRLLLSLGIADDPILPTATFRRLALSAGPKTWADAAIGLLRSPLDPPSKALAALEDSPMNMNRAFESLLALYH